MTPVVFALHCLPAMSLRREADAAQQIGEARVGAQRVVLRIHLQVAEATGALLASLFKPGKGLLVVLKAQAKKRESDRGDISAFRLFLLKWELRDLSCPSCSVRFNPATVLPVRSARVLGVTKFMFLVSEPRIGMAP